jgi:TRAP-type C4-dicarboxylate transport system substrate-binding protein
MRHRSIGLRPFAAAISFALLLVACGGGTASDDPTDPAGSTDAPPTSGTEDCESGIEARLAHHLSDAVVGHKSFEAMAEEIEAATEGRITLEVFPAGQLGGIAEWGDLLRDGVIEFAWVDASTLGAFAPDIAAPNLPFIFDSADQFHDIMDSDIGDDINALILERAGVELLGWSSVGALYPFFNGVEPAVTPADLQGVRIRTTEAPIAIETFQLLGMDTVPMPLGETYTALQTGSVNAYHLPYWATRATSLYEVSESMSEIPITFANLGIGVDPAWLAGLCEVDAQAVRTAAKNAETFNREGWPAADLEDREYLMSQGIEMVSVDDLDPFRELVRSQWDDFEEQAETDIFARMKERLGL